MHAGLNVRDIRDVLIEEAFYALTIARRYMPAIGGEPTVREDWEYMVVDAALKLLQRHIERTTNEETK